MAFKKYTQCYMHAAGDKPFNKSDLLGTVFGAGLPGVIVAIIGLILTSYLTFGIGVAIAAVMAIIHVSDEYLNHRLVCLKGQKCAIGKIYLEPEFGDLGQFDNDNFFNIDLMPHRELEDLAPKVKDKTEAETAPIVGTEVPNVHTDQSQGQDLFAPIITDLPYDKGVVEAVTLHCEAEGDFWVKMKEWAWLLGILIAGTTVVTIAGAAAGGAAGATAGCAILSFLGPIGCIIGAIVGALLGGAAAGAAGAAIIYGTLNAIFTADKGNVDDTNVGDVPLGPLKAGDKVIVYGEHVYDGFHTGWHEFHPLMYILRINDTEASQYLEWNPNFKDGIDPLPNVDPSESSIILTGDDIRQGLTSNAFRERVDQLIRKWCNALNEAIDNTTKQNQGLETNRWTIHPSIDGCQPTDPEIIK